MTSPSRFSRVSRRAVLQGLSASALLGLAGCSTNDAQVLAPSGAASTAAATTAPASTAPAATVSASAGELAIGFTYAADTTADSGGMGGGKGGGRGPGGGMVRNPYIAVWVEDTDGALVKTISLWHLQNGQDRWLSELHRWYAASDGVDTDSGATRAAGSYTVAWDLTDSDGKAVSDGTYVLCIEATREHGPYSLVTGDLTLKGKALQQDLDASGELSQISVDYTPA
ncbi:MAG: DUF2271 domain-containing protein [Propionibacteriaceae bacterium]|nr:DUF2271 domain-containing protein [Propionibacteriaceae bacterium]